MQLTVGAVLKICLSCTETIYFKIEKIESTALAVKQICSMKRDILTKERKDAPCSYIYKSELGVHYVEVDEEEKDWLRAKYKETG